MRRVSLLLDNNLKKDSPKKWKKIKVYPNGFTNTTYCTHQIFKLKGYEERKQVKYKEKRERKNSDGKPREDNLKRAKEKIFDIVLLNDFKYFITGTFAENEDFDRTDPAEVMKPLLKWLKNQTLRKGLQYVLTAERHKNGGIHFHAPVNDELPLTYSGRRLYQGQAWIEQDILKERDSFEPYKKIYNIDNWKYGYSTAIPCDNNKLKLARYVTKYITKGNDKIFGKYYWSSKNIEREPRIILTMSDFSEVEEQEFAPNGTSYRFKYDVYFSDLAIQLSEMYDSEIIEVLEDNERIQGLKHDDKAE